MLLLKYLHIYSNILQNNMSKVYNIVQWLAIRLSDFLKSVEQINCNRAKFFLNGFDKS